MVVDDRLTVTSRVQFHNGAKTNVSSRCQGGFYHVARCSGLGDSVTCVLPVASRWSSTPQLRATTTRPTVL